MFGWLLSMTTRDTEGLGIIVFVGSSGLKARVIRFRRIYACFYHISISYRSNLRPLGRNPMDVNMCLKHVMFDGCKCLLVVACGCIYTHIRH